MDEKDLQIFLTLADTGNLTRTAEKLYLAQPTLSKRLQNMESELGATLFLRSKQGVTLTPAGEEAQKVIQRTVQDFSTLREQLQLRKNTICGTLRIEASIDYSKYRLPQVLAAYTSQHPDVTLKVSTDHSRDCIKKLQDGKFHLAIVRGEYDWDEGKILLEREPVCLIRSRENADVPLNEMRYIGRDANPEHMSMKARWLMEHKMEPRSQLNVDGLSTCVAMVQAGLGWSIVPEICLNYFDGISEPLFFADGTPLSRSTYLLYRKRESELPPVREVIRMVCTMSKQKRDLLILPFRSFQVPSALQGAGGTFLYRLFAFLRHFDVFVITNKSLSIFSSVCTAVQKGSHIPQDQFYPFRFSMEISSNFPY